MNRIDRLYAIREELRGARDRGCTAEELSDVFAVSVRTIKRDIRTLKLGGFPIFAVPGPGGGYVVDAAATLPPINLTPGEISGLCAAVLGQAGAPYAVHARSALTKILAVSTPATAQRARRLAARVWINHTREPSPIDPTVLRTVEDALDDRRTLSIRYSDGEGHETELRVDPQLLGGTFGHWYLVAYCHVRESIRWFRLDRITAAHLTAQASTDRPVSDIGVPPDTARSV